MERQGRDDKGAVSTRTLFGETARAVFPALTLSQMVEDEDWRAAVRAQGGPFCYLEPARAMPF